LNSSCVETMLAPIAGTNPFLRLPDSLPRTTDGPPGHGSSAGTGLRKGGVGAWSTSQSTREGTSCSPLTTLSVNYSPMRAALFPAYLFLLLSPTLFAGDLRINELFADSMVLQRQMPIHVYGKAAKGTSVEVELNGVTQTGKTDAKGLWKLELPAMEAGGPYTLTVSSEGDEVVLKDVLVGEVWFCMGQSNMMFPFGKMHKAEAFDAIAGTDLPEVRLQRKGAWGKAVGDEQLKKWPITPLYFGRALYEQLKVPIGLVVYGVGGKEILNFGAREDFAADPEGLPYVELLESRTGQRGPRKEPHPLIVPVQGPKPRPYPFSKTAQVGAFWKHVKARLPFTARGMIWWQGENDIAIHKGYEPLFRTLIRAYRREHGKDLPFIFVQLPSYMKNQPGGWPNQTRRPGIAGLREAQAKVLSEPDTAMVVALDIYDNGGIHPTRKDIVGQRLADTAGVMLYAKEGPLTGPLVRDIEVSGSAIDISFDHVGDGLQVSKGTDVKGFKVAGSDKEFVPAKARIVGKDQVRVTADGVDQPLAVRYAWHENPPHNLTGSTGLPAGPFRSDDWPAYPAGNTE